MSCTDQLLNMDLVEKSHNPHAKDYLGWTPLHHAARDGHQSTVEYLIKSKQCDPNCKDNDGWTPLHVACQFGYQSIVEYLVDSEQCNPNCRDDAGWTPLHLACRDGHHGIVEYLIEKKQCNPNCQNNFGSTPLHIACGWGHQATVEYLIGKKQCDPNCKDNDGETPLHHACRGSHYHVVCYLLTKKCDPNIATSDGRTTLSLTRDASIIRELIKFGAKAENTYRRYLPGSYNKKPASSVVKTFIIGDPEAGKTTLTEAIKSESSGIFSNLSGRLFKVLKTNERTAGIVPHQFESHELGNVSFYDLAGQREFYASHDAMLQSSVPGEAAVYLIVADLSKSEEEFRKTILYWLSFISNQKNSNNQYVFVVGSHADQVHSKEVESRKATIFDSLSKSESFTCFHFSGFVAVDCRYAQSDPMGKLRQYLKHSYDVLRSTGTLEVRTHCFLVYLLEKNPSTPAITLSSVMMSMESEENKELASCIPHDIDHLVTMCEELSSRGNILFFNNPSNPVNSTIVLDQATLFSRVTGTIFAPESFKQHTTLANSTGLVPFTKLATLFHNLDSNMIIQFMCHLEFCNEVSDPEVLQLLHADSVGIGEEERFFFFPGLVSIQAPGKVWEQADMFTYHCGWQLQCTQSEHFFTPRFLQVLILQLAFSFALAPCPMGSYLDGSGLTPKASSTRIPTIHRRCTVWKNGIYWANRYGAEALIELSPDSKGLTVLIRCQKGCVVAATELRSGIIRKVLHAKKKFCPSVSCQETLMVPSFSALYPPSTSTVGVPICDVAETIVHAGPFVVLDSSTVRVEDLLGFEPYANLGEALLKEIFDEENQHYNEPLEDEFIYRIAGKTYPSTDLFIEMLALDHPVMLDNLTDQGHDGSIRRLATAIQLWRGDYHTIHHLREKLDQSSVFAGRNPLTMTH